MSESDVIAMTRQFYDELASNYHQIFANWEQSIQRQAHALDRIIRSELTGPPLSVLDCTCGIGTQAIGLAERGYQVNGSDLSPSAVRRAIREARSRGIRIQFTVADVRELDASVPGSFDVVLSCDNALPHLLTDEDLGRAARAIRAKLRTGGLFLASIRDYDRLLVERPRLDPPRVFDGPSGRRIVFQLWDWETHGQTYRVELFILRHTARGWTMRHSATRYRAIQRGELTRVLRDDGFDEIRWRMPDETGFFQPIVTARLPSSPLAR